MTQRRKVKHGPFIGYVSSMPKDSIPARAAAVDSRDFRYDPNRMEVLEDGTVLQGAFIERAGSAILGDTFGAIVGLTNPIADLVLRTRGIFEFPSVLDQSGALQFADGYPSYGAIYDATFTATVTSFGILYFRTTNSSGSNQYTAKSWSATTYPLTGSASFIKATPTWTKNGALLSRMGAGDSVDQAYQYGGMRSRPVVSGRWMYTCGPQCDPRRWNMLYNDSSASPTRKERHFPTGLLPPLSPAYVKASDLPTPTTDIKAHKAGTTWLVSMCWVFEDGTFGPPFIPRGIRGTPVTGGLNDQYGNVTLLPVAVAGADYYEYIKYSNLPKAPDGCRKALLVSPAIPLGANNPIAPLTDADGNLNLGILAVLDSNTTSYKDYTGAAGAVFDAEKIHAGHRMPPPTRYIHAFDGRLVVGGCARNTSPHLVVIAPTGVTNPNDNSDDDDVTLGGGALASQYFVRVAGNDLQLRRAAPPFPSAPTTNTISMANKTLQEVVDLVNATTPASSTGEWRAHLCAGVDGSLPSTMIAATSAACDFGDDGLVNDATTGNMRCFAQCYPGILQWDTTQYIARQPQVDHQSIWYTSAPPEARLAGYSASPNLWLIRNQSRPPIDSGILQGFAALHNGLVVFYSKKVWLFANLREGSTGRDEDYRWYLLSNDGCIAWDSIIEGNGWASWLSAKGMLATAGQPGDVRGFSGAIFNPNTNYGSLAYEVGKCLASVNADTDDMRFHARLFPGGLIKIKFRLSSSASVPDKEMEYDFNEGAGSGGLTELLRADGTPYGWSPPFTRPGEAMGFYHSSAGVVRLHAIETVGSSGSGRIDQMDTGYQDNGTSFTPVLHTKTDDLGLSRNRHRCQKVTIKGLNPAGKTWTMTHYRDRQESTGQTYTLENTPGSLSLSTETKRIKLAGQSPARVHKFKFSGARIATAAELMLCDVDVKILDTPVDPAG